MGYLLIASNLMLVAACCSLIARKARPVSAWLLVNAAISRVMERQKLCCRLLVNSYRRSFWRRQQRIQITV